MQNHMLDTQAGKRHSSTIACIFKNEDKSYVHNFDLNWLTGFTVYNLIKQTFPYTDSSVGKKIFFNIMQSFILNSLNLLSLA